MGQPLGATDHVGRIRFPLAFPATLTVRDASGRLAVATVTPGRVNQIQIEGAPRRLTVLHASNDEPVSGRAFPFGWQQGAGRAGLFLWTDPLGHVDLPVGPGTLTLCKSQPSLLLDSLWFDERRVASAGIRKSTMVAPVTLSNHEITLRVINDEIPLRLTDAQTNAPLRGEAYCLVQHSRHGGEWRKVSARTPFAIRSGVLMASAGFARPNPPSDNDPVRRCILMGQYEPTFIDGAVDLEGATIAMIPSPSRSLRILDPLNRPLVTRVVLELSFGAQIVLTSDANGLLGPFPWAKGENWTVWIGAADSPMVISAKTLEASAIVEVRPSSSSSAIRILGAPLDGPPIFASAFFASGFPARTEMQSPDDGTGASHARQTQNLLIDGLSPGDYAVGPTSWVAQLVSRATSASGRPNPASPPHSLLTRLQPDSTIEMTWNPAWYMTEALQGQVLCEGRRGQDLAVLPVYDQAGTEIYFGSTTPWQFCDSDGHFRIDSGDPEPQALLFADFGSDAARLQPVILDSQPLRNDGVYRVLPTTFELIASNASEWADLELNQRRRPTLYFRADPQALNAPMEFIHGVAPRTWNPADSLRTTGLPAHIASLSLSFQGSAPSLHIPLNPGANTRIEIFVPIPPLQAEQDSKQPSVQETR